MFVHVVNYGIIGGNMALTMMVIMHGGDWLNDDAYGDSDGDSNDGDGIYSEDGDDNGDDDDSDGGGDFGIV